METDDFKVHKKISGICCGTLITTTHSLNAINHFKIIDCILYRGPTYPTNEIIIVNLATLSVEGSGLENKPNDGS